MWIDRAWLDEQIAESDSFIEQHWREAYRDERQEAQSRARTLREVRDRLTVEPDGPHRSIPVSAPVLGEPRGAMTLVRIHRDLTRVVDGARPAVEHRHDDHPPLPSARALDRLRVRTRSGWERRGDPITWIHRDIAQWVAVSDLYRAGYGDDAHALWVLLRWCAAWPSADATRWRLDPDHVAGVAAKVHAAPTSDRSATDPGGA